MNKTQITHFQLFKIKKGTSFNINRTLRTETIP
jgi:hypothetical protein